MIPSPPADAIIYQLRIKQTSLRFGTLFMIKPNSSQSKDEYLTQGIGSAPPAMKGEFFLINTEQVL